jgi:hypothetical protein
MFFVFDMSHGGEYICSTPNGYHNMNDATSSRILAIYAKNGNPLTHCATCGRSAASPFRVFDGRGKVTAGCIDAFHSGHIYGESLTWHNRPEAKRMRKETLARLR